MASDFRLFYREFRRAYRTTGAIAPSGRRLARALARFVADGSKSEPRRILEVGPGTGSVTESIIAGMRARDTLDLVELNDRFVARLRERLRTDPRFAPAADRTRILHQPVESLTAEPAYDLIVSGLPLNNFEVSEVRRLLQVFAELLRPGGTLSFFQYIAIRPAKALVSGRQARQRLRGIGQALAEVLDEHEVQRDWIWPNLPPAWVHHVRPGGSAQDMSLGASSDDGRN